MFDKVYQMIERAENLSENDAWFFSIDSGVKNRILMLNTIDQLYNRGVDALNESLGEYSPYTIEEKKKKGHRYANITLRDTGDFYRSFNIEVTLTEIKITADPIKEDGTNLFEEFGQDVVGLTEENTNIVCQMILERILNFVRRELNLSA